MFGHAFYGPHYFGAHWFGPAAMAAIDDRVELLIHGAMVEGFLERQVADGTVSEPLPEHGSVSGILARALGAATVTLRRRTH